MGRLGVASSSTSYRRARFVASINGHKGIFIHTPRENRILHRCLGDGKEGSRPAANPLRIREEGRCKGSWFQGAPRLYSAPAQLCGLEIGATSHLLRRISASYGAQGNLSSRLRAHWVEEKAEGNRARGTRAESNREGPSLDLRVVEARHGRFELWDSPRASRGPARRVPPGSRYDGHGPVAEGEIDCILPPGPGAAASGAIRELQTQSWMGPAPFAAHSSARASRCTACRQVSSTKWVGRAEVVTVLGARRVRENGNGQGYKG